MFTGIVEACVPVRTVQKVGTGARIVVPEPSADWGARPDGSDPVGGWLGLKPYNADTEVSDFLKSANTTYVARDGHLVDHAQHGHTAIKPSVLV